MSVPTPLASLGGTVDERFIKGLPYMPHLVRDATSLYVGVVFDREAIAPLLHPGLQMSEEGTGGFLIYDAPDGWGLTPYRVGLVWVDLKGYKSEIGRPCRNFFHGFVQGDHRAKKYFVPQWPGQASFRREGDLRIGSAGPEDGVDYFRVTIRPTGDAVSMADTYNAVKQDDRGQLYLCTVSAIANRAPSEPVSIEILGGGEVFERMRPLRLTKALYSTDLSFTVGSWIPVEIAEPAKPVDSRPTFLNFLARFDRAAALVDADGRVVLVNGKAERLARSGITIVQGRLRCAIERNQGVLKAAIADTLSGGAEQATVKLDRSAGEIPLIVRVMPFELDLPGLRGPDQTRLALLVFTDPAQVAATDTAPALQLLGLTPAESKAAALVGHGLGPREAAKELGISEHSIRTYLKRVYSKLDLSRQSELAVLVSRIANIGG